MKIKVFCELEKRRITKDECLEKSVEEKGYGHDCPLWDICWLWVGHHSKREI